MNNKGLEALAALASVAPATSISVERSSGKQEIPVATDAVGRQEPPSIGEASHSLSAALQQALTNVGRATNTSTGQQNWQQAQALSSFGSSGFRATNSNLASLASMQQIQQADRSGLLSLQQQLSSYQYLMGTPSVAAAAAVTNQENPADSAAAAGGGGLVALAGQHAAFFQQLGAAKSAQWQQNIQHLCPTNRTPTGGANKTATRPGSQDQGSGPPPSSSSPSSSMATTAKSPQMVLRPGVAAVDQGISVSTKGVPSPATQGAPVVAKTSAISIAPAPALLSKTSTTCGSKRPLDQLETSQVHGGSYSESQSEDKKLQKRAANRRSAQLSRKRKKQFIDELKDENDALRRTEQILRAIPYLIVVFDSSGKLLFVSQSVHSFLKYSSEELEGTSFWDRLCQDSVRLLKAAFMDSLAARVGDSNTAPLGEGYWELRLVDKDGSQKIVTVNGVVHFAGDRPECVCTIRPRDQTKAKTKTKTTTDTETDTKTSNVLAESTSRAASASWIQIDPRQSVVGDRGCSSDTSSSQGVFKGREAVRISDSNSSGDSESNDEVEVSVTRQVCETQKSSTENM